MVNFAVYISIGDPKVPVPSVLIGPDMLRDSEHEFYLRKEHRDWTVHISFGVADCIRKQATFYEAVQKDNTFATGEEPSGRKHVNVSNNHKD